MTAADGRSLRVLFDTNAYDAIVAAGDEERIVAMVDAGRLSVTVTPVQEDEIRQISNRNRQARLLAVFRLIGGTRIEPASVLHGDIAFLSRDDILAQVADACCDLLVTEDRALRQRCNKAISYAGFARAAL